MGQRLDPTLRLINMDQSSQFLDPQSLCDTLDHIVKGAPLAIIALKLDGHVHPSKSAQSLGWVTSRANDDKLTSLHFSELLQRLPLDTRALQELHQQIERFIHGDALFVQRCYDLKTTEPYSMVVRATRVSIMDEIIFVTFLFKPNNNDNKIFLKEYSHEILKSQQEERKRISRELHDDTAQELAAIQINLDIARHSKHRSEVEDAFKRIEKAINSAHQQIRTLSFSLYPPELSGDGISQALRKFCSGFAQRTSLIVDFESSPNRIGCDADLEIALYRIAQEALTNAARHSRATKVIVRLHQTDGEIVLEVLDNGSGISLGLIDENIRESTGVGLLSMRERVAALGGDFTIFRKSGTSVVARIPLD